MTFAGATEPWKTSATELGVAIRAGRASSAEVVDAHLRRITPIEPR